MASFKGEGSASLLEDLEAQQEEEKQGQMLEQEMPQWSGEELTFTRRLAHVAILLPYAMLGMLVVCSLSSLSPASLSKH